MCRKWNRWTNRKEFCLAKFYGDNLSGAITFFGLERPQPSQIEAARQYYLSYVKKQEEASDASQDQETPEWAGAGFDTRGSQGQGDHIGQGCSPEEAVERGGTWMDPYGTEEIADGRR
jgi:hypothetical protein